MHMHYMCVHACVHVYVNYRKEYLCVQHGYLYNAYAHTNVCTCTQDCISTDAFIHTRAFKCMCIYVYIYSRICVQVYVDADPTV